MELHKASYQWATRPDDERYPDLPSLHAATMRQRNRSLKSTVALSEVAITLDKEGDLFLVGDEGNRAKFNHWSFTQFASRIGAPASYLRTLPPSLVHSLMNHGLSNLADEDKIGQLLLWSTEKNKEFDLRAITSEKYTRLWNHQIVERVMNLPGGWKVPPAYGSHHGGRPSGLYAGDHDMFIFLVNEENRIDDGTKDGLARGFFVWNTEVGGISFGMDEFLYRFICGNHIVWGAQNVERTRIRHIGAADDRAWAALEEHTAKYLESSPRTIENAIKAAKSYSLGNTKDDVVQTVFQTRVIGKKQAQKAYALAEQNEGTDGSPRSAWGLAQGITRLSRESQYADARVVLDRAAGRVLEMVGR